MKGLISHIFRSTLRPKPGPQTVGFYVADSKDRPEMVKRTSLGAVDSNRYFAQFTSVRIIDESTTLTANDDGALLIVDSADPVVITPPATIAGFRFAVFIKQADNGHSVSPAAADKIFATGVTAADDKDLVNSTSTVGASAEFVGDGVDGWFAKVTGTWTREA